MSKATIVLGAYGSLVATVLYFTSHKELNKLYTNCKQFPTIMNEKKLFEEENKVLKRRLQKYEPDVITKKQLPILDFETTNYKELEKIDFGSVREVRNCSNLELLKQFNNLETIHFFRFHHNGKCTKQNFTKNTLPDSVKTVYFDEGLALQYTHENFYISDNVETLYLDIKRKYINNNIQDSKLPKNIKSIYYLDNYDYYENKRNWAKINKDLDEYNKIIIGANINTYNKY